MNKQLVLEGIKEAKRNKSVYLLRNFMPDVPTWADFIENLNYKANSETKSHGFTTEKRIQDVVIYNNLDLFVSHAAEDGDIHGFPQLQSFIDYFKKDFGFDFFNIKSLINFVGGEADYWIHSDEHDVISWHCIGEVEWKIYKDGPNSEPISFKLNPGDLLFCPQGIFHEIVAKEPRASLVFDFNPANPH